LGAGLSRLCPLAAERLCLAYASQRGAATSVIALRYFTVYGPRQRPDMAFSRITRAALSGRAMSLYGTGTQRRDFTYVFDAVAATIAAADLARAGDLLGYRPTVELEEGLRRHALSAVGSFGKSTVGIAPVGFCDGWRRARRNERSAISPTTSRLAALWVVASSVSPDGKIGACPRTGRRCS
jgi:NAD dependent epimerase/dehydratase family